MHTLDSILCDIVGALTAGAACGEPRRKAELRLARQFSPNQISVELRAPICSSIHTKPDRCELETHVYMFVSTD